MNEEYAETDVERLIEVSNEREHVGRVERLRMLISVPQLQEFPCSALALAYHEEARLCWCMGAYVATIVMSQLAFEELLRAHYRAFTGDLDRRKKLDNASFATLIVTAQGDGWILEDEAVQLHNMRRNYRNAYVHPHDYTNWATQDKDSDKPNFQKQTLKIYAPELMDQGVTDEAWESIRLLVSLLPKVSRRLWRLD